MSATMTAANLRIALRATMPVVDRIEHPVLECVHLQVAGDRLLATATDRCVLSHARRAATMGHLDPVLMHHSDAELVLRMLAGHDGDEPVTLGRVGTRGRSPLYVRVDDRRLVLRCETPVDSWPGPSLAKIGRLIADRTTCSLDQVFAVDPWHLERLLTAVRPLAERERTAYAPAGAALRIYANGPDRPLRLEIGQWWLGVVMPLSGKRVQPPYSEIPNVPFGTGDAA